MESRIEVTDWAEIPFETISADENRDENRDEVANYHINTSMKMIADGIWSIPTNWKNRDYRSKKRFVSSHLYRTFGLSRETQKEYIKSLIVEVDSYTEAIEGFNEPFINWSKISRGPRVEKPKQSKVMRKDGTYDKSITDIVDMIRVASATHGHSERQVLAAVLENCSGNLRMYDSSTHFCRKKTRNY